MPAASHTPVERARPLLGTYVSIKLGGLPEAEAHLLIDQGFAIIAAIHDLMSFHEAASDVSALNRGGSAGPVKVSPHTYRVVSRALDFAALSAGVFDITVAPHLVGWGFLPRPENAPAPDPAASWRDIELLGDNHIRFHRPLWIDLGGIAKGYAVDCAVEAIGARPGLQFCVNAGGDLRVSGAETERVLLRVPFANDTVPVLEIENGSIASSSGNEHSKPLDGRNVGPHLDGRGRTSVGVESFVSVVAESCMNADGLTKVVLTLGEGATACLQAYGATAYFYDGAWKTIGGIGL